MGNASWSALFPDFGVHNLTMTGSDHRPIMVDTETYAVVPMNTSRRRRFEGRWLKEEKVGEVVATAWEHAPPGAPVASKLHAIHSDLHEWDRAVLKAPRKKVKELTTELEQLMSGPITEDSSKKQMEITRKIEIALEQEEMHYMQRSRANWLMHGDRNTKFFHNFARARRKRNAILKLKDENGQWKEGDDVIKPLIRDYFSSLFETEVDQTDPVLLDRVQPRGNTGNE